MTTEAAAELPAGFRQDRHGNLIAEGNIKTVDLEMDKVVAALAPAALQQRETLQTFKEGAYRDVHAFMERMAKRHKVQLGGAKGNVTLTSFDGRYQVKIQTSDRIEFGPQLEMARSLIGEYLDEVSEGASSDLRTIVNSAFSVGDGKANVSHAAILKLLQYRIEHAKWKRAMAQIREAIRVTDTASYIRFFERDANGKYQPIALDIATL